MKRMFSLTVVLVFFISVGIAVAGEYTGGPINAKLASEEIEGDFMTVWANNFADHMKKWSDGKIDITVYPYGTLEPQAISMSSASSAWWSLSFPIMPGSAPSCPRPRS